MTQQVAGFPYWEVAFNENGQPLQPEQARPSSPTCLHRTSLTCSSSLMVGTTPRQWPVTSTPILC